MRKLQAGIIALFTLLLALPAHADEGFWIPALLSKYKMEDIKKAGFKLSKEDIYSINKASIKDAVVGLSASGMGLKNFCTASLVSDKGLIMTNYHCILRYVEQYSKPGQDLLANGYWADTTTRELRCFDLKVNQLVEIRDVTQEITEGLDNLSAADRKKHMDMRGKKLVSELTKGTKLDAGITSFFGGNQIILAVYKVFEDVRLVGVPPITVGKFGGDSDNWQFPRHTGDFAFLRVYATSKNEPAKWRATNVPYQPKHSLTFSSKGVKEGDFAMVVGFPSNTKRYIPSHALEIITKEDNQHKINIREAKMNIINEGMKVNPNLKYRYTSRMSSMMNQLLRWRGELYGITSNNVVEQRKAEEQRFREWANATPERKAMYGHVLDSLESRYKVTSFYNRADLYFQEAGINGAEVVPYAGKFEKLVSMKKSKRKSSETAAAAEARKLKGLLPQYFAFWDFNVDEKIFGTLMGMYYNNLPKHFHPEYMTEVAQQYNGDFMKFAKDAYSTSFLIDSSKVSAFLDSVNINGVDKLTNDPLYKMAIGMYMINVTKIIRQRGMAQENMSDYYRLYQKGLLEMYGKDKLFADANSTMRLSYGKVKGVSTDDGLSYSYRTTGEGIYEKRMKNPGNDDYRMPTRLKTIIDSKDFGRYVKGDVLPVNFLTSVHTSSGNSGSPVLNARGEVIGLNFDRIWQGVFSDYQYDDKLSRNISVDSQYILFFLEKFAKSQYILNELKVK